MMTDKIDLPEARAFCPTSSRKLLAQGALLVDVREPSEVAAAGFADCDMINIPMSELEARWREIPRDRDVIMACAVGQRSLKATYFLMYRGYDRVANMSHGMKRWQERGFPVSGTAKAADAVTAACCSAASSQDQGCCGGTSDRPGDHAKAETSRCC